LNKTGDDYLTSYANGLIDQYPAKDQQELLKTEFKDWINESYEIGKDFVYNVTYNGTPSQGYLDAAYEVVRKRIVLGGYRLANEIINIYNSYEDSKEEGLHGSIVFLS
jgi:hypothetical protein